MSDLDMEAPLAVGEDWLEFTDHQQMSNPENNKQHGVANSTIGGDSNQHNCPPEDTKIDSSSMLECCFKETFSESLEDLVNTFDEKITKCFYDYDESMEKLAPVQVRSQEEIINNSQMWWTLTGNFGNILPIDWSQSIARKLHLPSLNLNTSKTQEQNGFTQSDNNNGDTYEDSNIDEEDLAKDLDLHSPILTSLHHEPVFTAEQVLEEIDEIMQGSSPCDTVSSDGLGELEQTNEDSCNITGIKALICREKLERLNTSQLNEFFMEIERIIQANSEVLIQELALRDELEFEKELKNTFISLLLGIQNKRRQHHMERKKGKGLNEPKYLTTVIPFNPADGPPDVPTIQILIKILKAVNEDSPAVPTLLTDFILKVLCPT